MGERGRGGEPIEWTGWVPDWKEEIEENPDLATLTVGASGSNPAEVIGTQAAKKRLSPEHAPPVPQTDTGRQGDISQGDRATLC